LKRELEEKAEEKAFRDRAQAKLETKMEREKLLKKMRYERIEKYGLAFVEKEEAEAAAKKSAGKTPWEMFELGKNKVSNMYTESRAPGTAKLCFKTCATFAGNVLKDVNEQKYRKVNLDNAAVDTRVAKIAGGKQMLNAMGFMPNDDGTNTLMMKEVDEALINKCIAVLKPLFE
jgi:hypothetical protein